MRIIRLGKRAGDCEKLAALFVKAAREEIIFGQLGIRAGGPYSNNKSRVKKKYIITFVKSIPRQVFEGNCLRNEGYR